MIKFTKEVCALRKHNLGRWVLILALATGSFVIPEPIIVSVPDTNGDFRVDVLDVQAVIACVLNGQTNGTDADVNGDGTVNILDFQRILDCVNQNQDGQGNNPLHQAPIAILPCTRAESLPAPNSPLVSVPTDFLRTAAALVGRDHDFDAVRTATKALSILGLTQHAPPVCA